MPEQCLIILRSVVLQQAKASLQTEMEGAKQEEQEQH
jgi:hypothetical protein